MSMGVVPGVLSPSTGEVGIEMIDADDFLPDEQLHGSLPTMGGDYDAYDDEFDEEDEEEAMEREMAELYKAAAGREQEAYEDDGMFLGLEELKGPPQLFPRTKIVKKGDAAGAYEHVYNKTSEAKKDRAPEARARMVRRDIAAERKRTQRQRLELLLNRSRRGVEDLNAEIMDLEEITKHSTRVIRARGVELERLNERLLCSKQDISNWCYNPEYEPTGNTVEDYARIIQKRWKSRSMARKVTAMIKGAIEKQRKLDMESKSGSRAKDLARQQAQTGEAPPVEEDLIWEPPEDDEPDPQTAMAVAIKVGKPGVQASTDKLAFFRVTLETTFAKLKRAACEYFSTDIETFRTQDYEFVDGSGNRWLPTQCVHDELSFLTAAGPHVSALSSNT